MAQADRKMSRMALTAMVVGGMIGAGIFSLPRTFAQATGPLGAVIAWLIAGSGMYMLARVFQTLADRKPDIDAGVFAYAKEGFGDYPGFLSAFGYWIGSCIGNVSYWVLIKSTLGAFFPIFGDGNTAVAIAFASLGIWLFHFLILRGTQQAAFINSVVTVAKIIPILVFLVIALFAFKGGLFRFNLYGGDLTGGIVEQVKATMLVTVFVFIGIEGASVYSRFAKERSDVGKATILGFIGVTGLMVLVTLLPFGVLERAQIAGLRQPSMAGVLESIVGPWGADLRKRRAHRLGAGRVPRLGAHLRRGDVRRREVEGHAAGLRHGEQERGPGGGRLGDHRRHPGGGDLHLLVARCVRAHAQPDQRHDPHPVPVRGRLRPDRRQAREGLRRAARGAQRDMVVSSLAVAYTLFMIYAGGFKFIVLSAVLFAPGTVLYVQARREQRVPVFARPADWAVFATIVAAAVYGIYGLTTGAISI